MLQKKTAIQGIAKVHGRPAGTLAMLIPAFCNVEKNFDVAGFRHILAFLLNT